MTDSRGGGRYLGYEHTGRCRWKILKPTLSRSQIPENDTLSRIQIYLNNTLSFGFFRQNCALARKFVRNLSKNVEILPSKRFESHSQSANGLKRPFGVKNYKYGPCHGADFYKNDTLSRSRNPENDTLFSGTSPYRKIDEYTPGDRFQPRKVRQMMEHVGYSMRIWQNVIACILRE